MIYIGIDPGAQTGLAIWNSKTKRIACATTTFWGMVEQINHHNKLIPDEFKVVIEDPGANKAMHWNQHKKTNINYACKIAQNVGMNKRDAQLLIQLCENLDIPVKRVKPTKSKWDDKRFKMITGYKRRCSQHARDAARLVYGM